MHARAEAQVSVDSPAIWKVAGRTTVDPLPEDWRNQLAIRLGHRPRRIGILAELALYGALDCLESAGEKELPRNDLLRLCSRCGPVSAITQVIEQMHTDLPMPFSFLQSQASQILPALAGAMNWHGDAGVVMAKKSMDLAILAVRQAGRNGMLLGWVEESHPYQSFWVRLVPCAAPSVDFSVASSFEEMCSKDTHYWRTGRSGVEVGRG